MQRMAIVLLCFLSGACSKQGDNGPLSGSKVALFINEVFPAGGKDATSGDWLEIYNADTTIELTSGAWFLTDDPDDLLKFELPGITFVKHSHLRIWCDDTEGAGIHANFRLASKGEWLAVVRSSNGRSIIIDSMRYAPKDCVGGRTTSRFPDGGGTWVARSPATPGSVNGAVVQR